MKKLIEKDKKIRKKIEIFEKKKFILKIISNNFFLNNLIRYNAIKSLNRLPTQSSKTLISKKCVLTLNKKKFNKLTNFSRIIFRKLVKKEKIFGVYKLSR